VFRRSGASRSTRIRSAGFRRTRRRVSASESERVVSFSCGWPASPPSRWSSASVCSSTVWCGSTSVGARANQPRDRHGTMPPLPIGEQPVAASETGRYRSLSRRGPCARWVGVGGGRGRSSVPTSARPTRLRCYGGLQPALLDGSPVLSSAMVVDGATHIAGRDAVHRGLSQARPP
jgi:hypothetical protein